jgi:type IV secretory pathway TrbL component
MLFGTCQSFSVLGTGLLRKWLIPDMQAAHMFANLSPEQAKMYAGMAQSMHQGGTASTTGTSNSAVAGMSDVGSPAMDPKMAAEMMANMSDEQLQAMTQAAAASGMLPSGMTLSAKDMKVCSYEGHDSARMR